MKFLRSMASLLCAGAVCLGGVQSHAGEAVTVLVLKEQGVGSASAAQPYVDKLVSVLGELSGWGAAEGKYHSSRRTAAGWIASAQPSFGILSLGAFLALRAEHSLQVVGKAQVDQAGDRQYHLISQSASGLAGCKGKKVASNHFGDVAFVEGVIAAGAFKMSEFTPVKTRRPMQTVKTLTAGEADCALVDDAQLAAASKVEGGGKVKAVWSSAELPPMVVVAFPKATPEQRKKLKANLPKVCSGAGAQACTEVGIKKLGTAGDADYAKVVKAYGG